MARVTAIAIVALCAALCWAGPAPRDDAPTCDETKCTIDNNCRCSSTRNPAPTDEPSPQLIAITYSESMVQDPVYNYIVSLFYERANPDGLPVALTSFVNHEYTDYRLVQDLYLHGFEIGVHSITKNTSQEFWRSASVDELVEEFQGQREIIAKFANLPIDDVVGARTPQLQLEDDISIEAYVQSGVLYDNSWPTLSNDRLLPYTLDFKSTQQCTAMMTCPKESHPGFWISPITSIKGGDGKLECNSLATCEMRGDANQIADWLTGEVERVRNDNRAPLVLRLDSYWFSDTENSYEGFTQFLDRMQQLNDVFFVSVGQVINWTKNPVPLSQFTTDDHSDRLADCYPVECKYTFNGDPRSMGSCVACPDVYPWKGNPNGDPDL